MKVITGAEKILNNPFSVLGLPCNAEKMNIIRAQEKLNKLSKIGAEKSYKTEFLNELLPEVNRSAGIIQSSIAKIDEPSNKLFWFVDANYLKQYNSKIVKSEFLNANNFEDIIYDCFLANYLDLLLNDSDFAQTECWQKVLRYIESLLKCGLSTKKNIFYSRYQFENEDLYNPIGAAISKNILSPITDLAEILDSKIILSIINLVSEFNIAEFKDLKNSLLEQVITEVDKECTVISDFIETVGDIKNASKTQVSEATKFANKLSNIGKSVIDPLSKSYTSDDVVVDRIKDSFYNEMMKLANILAFSKSFKNAYACATQANKYAPSHKKSEIKDTLKTFKELKDSAEVIDQAGGIESLSYKDKNLIESDDISISLLAYRAIAGDPESQCVLGNIYKTPTYERNAPVDIPYDVTEGLKWIKKSANQGYAAGQLAFGMCYISGEGVGKDFRIADSWIQKSAAQGNEEAKALISDYRYATIKMQFDRSNSYHTNSEQKSYAWVWWLLGIIIVIIIIAVNNSGY